MVLLYSAGVSASGGLSGSAVAATGSAAAPGPLPLAATVSKIDQTDTSPRHTDRTLNSIPF